MNQINLKVLNLILLGDPAAGKATQANYLSRQFGLYDFDMGNVLRNSRKDNKEIDKIMSKTIDQGKLAPTKIVRKIFSETVNKVPKSRGIVFDGTPKMLGEAKLLVKLLKETKRSFPLVIYLQIPADETVKRMKNRKEYFDNKFSHRADDTAKALKNRVKYYRKNIKEVVDYFQTIYTFSHIDGLGTKQEVRKRMMKAIDFYLKNYEQINQNYARN